MTEHQPNPAACDRQTIRKAWARLAHLLVEWALALVVRQDAHGRYYRKQTADAAGVVKELTKPYTEHAPLTDDLLTAHFNASRTDQICGLHVSSRAETCRVVVVDIDAHDDQADRGANWRMAQAVRDRAEQYGLQCLVLASNGAGGYHVWFFSSNDLSMADAWRLGKWLVHDHAECGLAKEPETFPKSPHLTGKGFGNWVRLPGRHHKRDHWTQVWCPSRQVWLEGEEAIRAIIACTGRPVDVNAIVPADFQPGRRSVTPTRGSQLPKTKPGSVGSTRRSQIAGSFEDLDCEKLEYARQALEYLGDDYRDDYHRWLRVAMALKRLGEPGLKLWHIWSAPSPKYDPAVLDEKWLTFGERGDGHVTLGTLFYMAKNAGWPGFPQRAGPAHSQEIVIHVRLPRIEVARSTYDA